jgi:protein ImuA
LSVSEKVPGGLVESLRERIAHIEGARRPRQEHPLSTGCEGLDRLLPAGGLNRGTLVEWLAAGVGTGAETLALLAAREAVREGGALVIFDGAKEFYPPEAVRLGIAAEVVIVVQAASEADCLWALDQALRCPGVAAVLAHPGRLDGKNFRRLQLAAEEGGGLGCLLRSERDLEKPSWADVRLRIEPRPQPTGGTRRFRIEVIRGRGGASGGSIEVEFNDETRTLHLVSPVAHPAAPRRAARA